MPETLLTPKEMSQADTAAVAMGCRVEALMAAAGRAVARAVRARFAPCRTLVLCGPGNNGGDGYVAARLLDSWGWPVRVAALAAPRGDAAVAASGWRGPVVAFAAGEVGRAELVIDAVFGAGLGRDVDPAVAEVLRAARRLVAVDVPSGLDGATGQVRGFAPQAVLTVTFFRRKPGHLLLPGRGLCGEVVLADIGLPAAVLAQIRPLAVRNTPGLWRLPAVGAADHKYSRGHVTIMGGAEMTGAARLAAAAARRAGAGLVTIAALGAGDVYRAGDAGVLVSEAGLAALLEDARRGVWLCGPGLGAPAGQVLDVLRGSGRLVVADADALSACAGAPERLRGVAVATPHAGEFARVFGPVGPDKLAAVRAAARASGAVVVLKGADTVIAAPDGRVAINDNAAPWLATAGSGDVLAGIVAGLLGQGMAAWEAACAAVWLHGAAARQAGPGLLAEDLPACLPSAMGAAVGSAAAGRDSV